MLNDEEYTADRFCPVFNRTISCDLCYESVLGLSKAMNVSAVPELDEVEDIENARKTCSNCKYSDFE